MSKNLPQFNYSKIYEFIVNSSEDAIVSKTLDGIVLSWNDGAEKLFGYSGDEMIGKPMSILFPKDRKSEEMDMLEKISYGQTIEHFETVRICKDGSEIDISVTLSPILDDDDKIIGASKIARDISSVKNAERLLEKQKANLAEQNWIQDGVVDLYEEVSGELELLEVCDIMLTSVANYIGASIGALYMRKDNILSLVAGFAYPKSEVNNTQLEIGEGLIGQVANDKLVKYIDVSDKQDLVIQSGLIKIHPKETVIMPLLYGRRVIAVVELGSLALFTPRQKKFLKEVASTMAMIINSAKAVMVN